jgi:putative NIF3 family GTP cyclohydrolase 1 type 2
LTVFFEYNRTMNILEFDTWCRSFLEIESMERVDISLNGLQIGDQSAEIEKIVFAVDACLETLQ